MRTHRRFPAPRRRSPPAPPVVLAHRFALRRPACSEVRVGGEPIANNYPEHDRVRTAQAGVDRASVQTEGASAAVIHPAAPPAEVPDG